MPRANAGLHLLQTIYQAFDLIKRRKVFKVETIGDSYVAVCGLPKPDETTSSQCPDSHQILAKFTELTNKLEEKLEPRHGSRASVLSG
jgi:hypothetical protein